MIRAILLFFFLFKIFVPALSDAAPTPDYLSTPLPNLVLNSNMATAVYMWADKYKTDGTGGKFCILLAFPTAGEKRMENSKNSSVSFFPYDSANQPVLDTGTVVLIGSGLLSLAFYGKKKLRK